MIEIIKYSTIALIASSVVYVSYVLLVVYLDV